MIQSGDSVTKRFALAAVLLILAPLVASAALMPREVDDRNGQDAPAIELETLDGKKVTLAELKGRPVILSYFASWCPPCRAEVKSLVKLHERYAARGLAIVGAAADRQQMSDTAPEEERKDVTAIVQELKIPYPV